MVFVVIVLVREGTYSVCRWIYCKKLCWQRKEMFEKLSMTQPIGRMAEPIEIAHLALYLCSDEAAFVTGTDFPIDGGYIRLNS